MNIRKPMSEETKLKISNTMKNKKTKKKVINRPKFDEMNGLKNPNKYTYK